MGIRFVRNKSGIYETSSCYFIEPSHLLISDEEIKEYLAKHPFPKDENYSIEDLKRDLRSDGSFTLPNEINDETGEYIARMISELL